MKKILKSIYKVIKSKTSMKVVEHCFIDRCNGRTVYKYKDCYGQMWMAQSKFGYRTKL